jgi:predicted amidophosphoribosyltransferase
MICPRCKVRVIGGDKFCVKCGFDLRTAAPNCPVCGAPFMSGHIFCAACGHRLGDEGVEAGASVAEVKTGRKPAEAVLTYDERYLSGALKSSQLNWIKALKWAR